MNGATTEPCDTTKIPPTIIKGNNIGANHNFFLTFKNIQNSFIFYTHVQKTWMAITISLFKSYHERQNYSSVTHFHIRKS